MDTNSQQLLDEFNKTQSTNAVDSKALVEEFRQTQAPKEESGGGVKGSFGQELPQIHEDEKIAGVLDRLAMAYGDESGNIKLLKDKGYPYVEKINGQLYAGKDPKNMSPVDPEGFFNDALGEVADNVPLITNIGATIIGSLIGTAVNPGVGTVAGAATGSGISETINQTIGKLIGNNERSSQEVLGDIALNTAFGAAGEATMLGARAIGPSVVKGVGKSLGKISKVFPKGTQTNQSAVKATSRIMNILSGVSDEAVEKVFQYGDNNVFTPQNMNGKNVLGLIDDIQGSINSTKNSLGNEVERAVGKLGSKSSVPVIPIDDIYGQLTNDLKSIGLMTESNTLNKAFVSEGSDKAVFSNILKQIGGVTRTGGLEAFDSPKMLSIKDAIQLKRQFANAYEKLSPEGQGFLTKFLRGSQLKPGLSSKLDQVAAKFNVPEFNLANKAFSSFMDSLDDLRGAGLQIGNKSSINNFIDGYFKRNDVVKQALRNVQAHTSAPIVQNIEKFATAQAFSSVSPQLLRLGAIASLLGAGTAKTREGKIGFTGLAFLLGSPKGASILLRTLGKASRGAKGVVSGASQKLGKGLNPNLSRTVSSGVLSQTGANLNKKSNGT